uniref:Annexin n=1 Tax=Glycine max TaxID=3847 RepID=A0A0R0HNL0_SOYBN
MATLIAPSNHPPVEDTESLRKAVKAMYRWILEHVHVEREALLANIALKSADKNYQVIVEISCVLSPEELFVVRRAYHNKYKRSLEEDVAANTSGHLRQATQSILVGLVSSFRYGGSEINAKLAQSEDDALHEAIKNKNKRARQLVATFNRYRDDHGIAITKKLFDEGSDEFHKAANLAVSCINDHKKYCQKVLCNAMEHVGTDEDALTRVIVTRAEKDLKEIKEMYYKRNIVHLEHVAAKETS